MTSPRHFIDLPLIPASDLHSILDTAMSMKARKYRPPQIFRGLSLAMMFDKRSTRTRISFELAMKQLGGHTIVMQMQEMQVTGSESLTDTGQVLSRFVDAVMIRMSDHEALSEIARHATIPVINGLTNHSHPCQIMADMLTIKEKFGAIEGLKIAWFGDLNNVTRTFIHAAKIWNFELVVSAPRSLLEANQTPLNSNVRFEPDALIAAIDADVVVTDTWVSMGQEGKLTELFMPYQVNSQLMSRAKTSAVFMHCMPIHRGEEVTNEVLDSAASIIYDEAENRLHAQKAILNWCFQDHRVEPDYSQRD